MSNKYLKMVSKNFDTFYNVISTLFIDMINSIDVKYWVFMTWNKEIYQKLRRRRIIGKKAF